MIKRTHVYYPNEFKIYDNIESFIAENDFTDFYNFMISALETCGITEYSYTLSDDKTIGITTTIFADEIQEIDYNNIIRTYEGSIPSSHSSDEHLF